MDAIHASQPRKDKLCNRSETMTSETSAIVNLPIASCARWIVRPAAASKVTRIHRGNDESKRKASKKSLRLMKLYACMLSGVFSRESINDLFSKIIQPSLASQCFQSLIRASWMPSSPNPRWQATATSQPFQPEPRHVVMHVVPGSKSSMHNVRRIKLLYHTPCHALLYKLCEDRVSFALTIVRFRHRSNA